MLVRLPILLLVIVDLHLLQDLFLESNVSILISRKKHFFFKLKKLQFHEFFNFFAEEANSWQSNRPQVNRNRNTNNRGRRQSRPVTTVETNPALAALTLPPKERPDAKHHLKVIIFFYVKIVCTL